MSNKFKWVITLAVSVSLTLASVTTAIDQKPLRLEQSKKQMIAAPPNLAKHGIFFYDFAVDLPAQVNLILYDVTRNKLFTVRLSENAFEHRFVYKIRSLNGEESWVKVEWQQADSELLYSATSSIGQTIGFRLQKGDFSKRNNSGMAITSIEVSSQNGWAKVRIPYVRYQNDRKSMTKQETEDEREKAFETSPLVQIERERLFVTPTLKVLQDVLYDFAAIQKSAIGGQESTTVTQSDSVVLPEEGSGCNARCFRMATLVPVYVCDDGFWNNCTCSASQGIWLIAECGIRIICNVECGRFSGGTV